MKFKHYALILFGLFIMGCNQAKKGTYKNAEITSSEKEKIKHLNDKLFQGIITNNANMVLSIMSPTLLINDGKNIPAIVKQVNSFFSATTYSLLDEYYTISDSVNIRHNVASSRGNQNDYSVDYLALNKEMYVSLLMPVGLENDLLITAIYGKYESEWKLNILQFGQYSIGGKTSFDLYQKAQQFYNKGYMIDAIDQAILSNNCLQPANEFWHFNKHNQIKDFYDKLIKEANEKYVLPLTLENIKTKPKLFRIFPERLGKDGYFPMIFYQSTIDLKDTLILKEENLLIRQEVARIFNGIDKDKKFIYYKAFNELPSDEKRVYNYGFVQEFK
ncbi:MAG: hypothetical protein IT236_06995 [Bacteroidia bacterium]|nr:hypothetical protein [Bacteroidia bacterium]